MADKRCFSAGLLLALAVLLLDQMTKQLALAVLFTPDRPVIEVTSFFNLVMVWNYGISFGLFSGQAGPLIFISVSTLITCILLIWLHKNSHFLTSCALGLVIGGAIGNVADRLRFGAVADFLDFHIGPYHWPAFNIADSSIFIGVVLLCADSMLRKGHISVEGRP